MQHEMLYQVQFLTALQCLCTTSSLVRLHLHFEISLNSSDVGLHVVNVP